ncbi:glycosyltransferase [Paenarthrobacter sp. NyZ202]|uniref:glycosyltransferase n=1 Tax=Paenarthrobacter sp. NyZ202 TaxID=3402689 RepID=UPI003CF40471
MATEILAVAEWEKTYMSAANKSTEARGALVKRRLKELEYSKSASDLRQQFFGSNQYISSVLSSEPIMPSYSAREYLHKRSTSPLLNYAEQIRPVLDSIPTTLGTRSLKPHSAHVGIIADEFLYKSFDSTAKLTYVTPDNYVSAAEEVEILLIASTWRGLSGEWINLATPHSNMRSFLLEEVLPYYRGKDLPIVFYSKEDPPNYQQFLSIAQAADYVFTCAAEVVSDYERDCPNVRSVNPLSFGVNPLHHSPVYSRRHRVSDVLFAGSWHAHKYPERRAAAHAIFEGVAASSRNLVIFDRNWGLESERYFFPEEYIANLAPSIGHNLLLKLQRLADFNINLNSVIGSETMYANRVVELQAMGSMVISNYNVGVNNRFPNVLTCESSVDVRDTLDQMSAAELYEVQMEGLRRAYSDHLSHDRMGDILRIVGNDHVSAKTKVCVVVDESTDYLRSVVDAQTLTGLTVLNADELASGRQDFDVVVPLSTEFEYAPTYMEDLVNAFKYADVDFVTKAIDPGVADHEITSRLSNGATGAIWAASPAGDKLRRGDAIEGYGYALDSMGIVRRQDSIELSETSARTDDFLVSVIIPVYNNGPFLLNKCIRSLSRSSIFDKMQILMVDDGSTDLRTQQIINEIDSKYEQVSVFKFEQGGSGSASRARNKGLGMASAPWITYLDPDNEAVGDGYARLIELAAEKSLDLAIGDMLRYAEKTLNFKNSKKLKPHLIADSEGGSTPDPEILSKMEFYPMSNQAMVINAQWLKGLGIEQPVGALGQDSFFFQQMVYYARKIGVLEHPIHIYYGSVSKSVVNTIGPNFFKKYIPLEAARSAWLREIGLIQKYNETRGQSFMKLWFLRKLELVHESDRSECVDIIRELGSFYEPVIWEDPDVAELMAGDRT